VGVKKKHSGRDRRGLEKSKKPGNVTGDGKCENKADKGQKGERGRNTTNGKKKRKRERSIGRDNESCIDSMNSRSKRWGNR